MKNDPFRIPLVQADRKHFQAAARALGTTMVTLLSRHVSTELTARGRGPGLQASPPLTHVSKLVGRYCYSYGMTSSPGLTPSPDGSRRPRGLFQKLWGKVIKARQSSSNPVPVATNSSERNHTSLAPALHTCQDPSPHMNLVPNASPGQVVTSCTTTAKAELPGPKSVNGRLANTTRGVTTMNLDQRYLQIAPSASNNIKCNIVTIGTFTALCEPLKMFNSIADEVADLHPYAKTVLSMLTNASKMILNQTNFDGSLSDLVSNVSTVYVLMSQRDSLARMSSMLDIDTAIAQHTLKCAELITRYSKKKHFWKQLSKHASRSADAEIDSYNGALKGLIQRFRDQLMCRDPTECLDPYNIEYAMGAGLNTSMLCLRDTRSDLLTDIKSWIRSTGQDVPRVLWLSGTPGTGKSTIAHTITNWFNELGGLTACFCIDRRRGVDHYEKIFTTIARDLAACNPAIQQALVSMFREDDELWKNARLMDQWQKFVVQPITMAAINAPVLIVIDALDETNEGHSRERILRALGCKLKTSTSRTTKLPANFRILVTSRPLEDFHNHLDAAPHIRHLSLNDILAVFIEHDIQLYVSSRLAELRNAFDDVHFKILAQKSSGLFEWARLACEYIKRGSGEGVDPMGRFKVIVAGTPESCTGEHLLDDMYGRFLKEIITGDTEMVAMFRAVMGQVLVSLEPLSMTALAAMRQHFPSEDSHYEVEHVVKSMGTLLAGILDPQVPIRPLHTSFYDFLVDESRSGKFFIDISSVNHDLAFASLRVMNNALRFNICSLESSYLPNSAVHDLETRVKECISAELSYSCRFWCTHVRATPFEPSLAEEIKAFFNGEHLLYWFEVLALMKQLSGSVESLSSITDWSMGHTEYMHIGDAARDAQQFVRIFGTAIAHSTPHLYLSALPFSPTQSMIFTKFATKFPFTPQVVAGHVARWPLVDKALDTRAEVQSIAFSPDGKMIAYGTDDGMIRLWDMETTEGREALGPPLRGHTASVQSVAFSPNGRCIVSGSWDKTIRVWDIKTHEAIGSPIQGHTDYIECVAISPDSCRIVSCSRDKTIRMWDIQTGDALGDPLKGHTGYVWSTVISSDGKRIVSGSEDKTVRVWDVESGNLLYPPLRGHLVGVRSVAISPDGKRIVSGASGPDDMTLRAWDVETGKALSDHFYRPFGPIRSVQISPDGKRVVSSSIGRTIRVWDMETGEVLGDPLRGHLGRIHSIAISPDGQFIASGSDDKMIRVWDMDTKVHLGRIWSAAISSDGKLVVSGSDDGVVRVWDAESGGALYAPLRGHSKQIWSVALSPDGRHIVSGSEDETIRIWDARTGKALGDPLRGHLGPISSVAISPDGKHIVSGSDDQKIRVWDIETGKMVGLPLRGHTQPVRSVAISADGKHIVSCSGGTISSDDGMIQLWDVETGGILSTLLQGHNAPVQSVAISLDGKHIVAGVGDTIQMWDMETCKILGTPFRGHTGHVHSVAISPDGRYIISGDHAFWLWDTETSKVSNIPFRTESDDLLSVAISANGQHIVSGSSDMSIRVWDPELFVPYQYNKIPVICFSSSHTHALCHASPLLQCSSTPVSLIQTKEGWIMGPEGQLLLWIPANLYPVLYAPGNILVIPNHALQLDLSCFAHGTSWHKCQK